MALTRRDISLTVALCASLTLHTFLLRAAADLYSKQFSHISLPGFPKVQMDNLLFVQTPDDPEHRLGDSKGTGDSLSESPGQTPMQASKGPQNQPLLGLDAPRPGRFSDEPSDSQMEPSQPSAQAASPSPPAEASAASPATPPPSEPVTPFGMDQSANDFTSPQNPSAAQAARPPAQAAAPAVEPPSGNPAPQGDSESDPITVAGAAVFQHGYSKVRMGRDHKITRPHLSLAAQADLLTLPRPIVVLKLRIDETGKVTSATIFRSSGSDNIDQPVKLAAYNWWFEPAKDQSGKPTKDVILFTVGFLD